VQILDDIGCLINFTKQPKRIISLVPSFTETLFEIGLGNNLVGITKFCVHPTQLRKQIPLIGGTKNINISKIEALAPDIVFASKEENIQEQVNALKKFTQVHTSDIKSVFDVLQWLAIIEKMFQVDNALLQELKNKIDEITKYIPAAAYSAVYLIWQNPFFTIGGDTFINSMLSYAGIKNVFQDNTRYPTITIEDIAHSQAEIVLLSSEPFPFKEKHVAQLQTLLPTKKIMLVDGEIFSWYGWRMTKALPYFALLHNSLSL
jgi:ABC-type Fe3+-hydroxamate transport system substrate-binding protein